MSFCLDLLIFCLPVRICPETARVFTQCDFPLMQRAVELSCHNDGMVRTTARTCYMTLMKIKDEHVQKAGRLNTVVKVLLSSMQFDILARAVAVAFKGSHQSRKVIEARLDAAL